MANPRLQLGRKHQGFTLVELMIVVGIIGLLATVALPEFQNLMLHAKKAEREAMLTSLMHTVNDYWSAHNTLPENGGRSGNSRQRVPSSCSTRLG